MNDMPTLVGHRMVLAIMELADDQTKDLAQSYEASVVLSEIPWQQLEHIRQKLWEALIRRAQRGEIAIKGVLDPVAGAVWISSDALRGSRPNFLADALEVAGTTFHAIHVFEAEAISQTDTQLSVEAPPSQKGRGGVAPTYDWDEFVRELTRALFAGELVDRRSVKKHMTTWCSDHWPKQPDEKSVRLILGRFLHRSIPEKSTRNN